MSKRIGLMTAIVVASVVALNFSLTAQPPIKKPVKELQLPDDAELRIEAIEPDVESLEEIGHALRTGNTDESADPLLKDLLQGRRSILKGSVLDESVDGPQNQTGSQQARVAEQLLKSARLLENIKPVDITRRELVNQMRREAVRLLSP